tara:strand:- start:311 stop:436 length:126 start_codon:yes stop_codon:yes gene_type:complete
VLPQAALVESWVARVDAIDAMQFFTTFPVVLSKRRKGEKRA